MVADSRDMGMNLKKKAFGTYQDRNKVFDIVKGITIYLVVAGHMLPESEKTAAVLISACHMPVFFFISGFFYKDGYGITAFAGKKTAALLVPYICWSSVSLFVNGIPMLAHLEFARFKAEIIDIFISARSVWFLPAIFLAEMIYFCVRKSAVRLSGSPYIFGMLAWVLAVPAVSGDGAGRVLGIDKLVWLFPYFVFGNMCREGSFACCFKKSAGILNRGGSSIVSDSISRDHNSFL